MRSVQPSPCRSTGSLRRRATPHGADRLLRSTARLPAVAPPVGRRQEERLADIVDRTTRSRMMAGIKGRDTKPEMILRAALHRRGLRYRLHASGLPGRPDIVLPRYRAAVLVHGCFWHRHGCRLTSTPTSNSDFWQAKFVGTVERDARQARQLAELGWRVATVWECALRDAGPDAVADAVAAWLVSTAASIDVPSEPDLQRAGSN